MLRTLYRIYLYLVWLLLLIFAAGATVAFLSTFLRSVLRYSSLSTPVPRHDIVQSATLAIVSWIITAGLGGLHYWLTWRDIREDPGAATGAVRALALNFVQAVSALVGIFALARGVSLLGEIYRAGAATPLALGIVWLGVALLIELERRRTPPRSGAPLILQRLHLYGVQFITLLFMIGMWQSAASNLIQHALISAGYAPDWCRTDYLPAGVPVSLVCQPLDSSAVTTQVAWQWAGVLAAVLGVVIYGWLARRDRTSAPRLVGHYLGFAAGIISLAIALYQIIYIITRISLGVHVQATVDTLSFVSWGTVGALIVAFYAFWLVRDATVRAPSIMMIGLAAQAIVAAILAFPFWFGWSAVLLDAVNHLAAGAPKPTPEEWARGVALVLTGIPYILFALRVRWGARARGVTAPRRALVLAALAAGVLTSASSFVVLAYTFLTLLLGAPLASWQNTARSAGVILGVGLVLTAIYIWRMTTERGFQQAETPSSASVSAAEAGDLDTTSPSAPEEESVESLLRALVAGHRTVEATAEALRQRGAR